MLIETTSEDQIEQLRLNRKVIAKADSHGDIWLQAVEKASRDPGAFQGRMEDIMGQMADALQLHDESGVPLRRLATLWRNERWRGMITRWCGTVVGRATFRISTWDWMISCRIDDVRYSPAKTRSITNH